MSDPQKKYPKSYRVLLDQALDLTDFNEEKIKQLLRDKFESFSPKDTAKYLNYLLEVNRRNKSKDELEKAVAARMKGVPCPICGAKTTNPKGRAGRYTKTPEWQCSKGGLGHFLQDKANHIVSLRNQRENDPSKHKPLPFPPEATIEIDIGSDGNGVQKPDTERSTEDPGANSGMDNVQEKDERQVQNFTPVRLPSSGSH